MERAEMETTITYDMEERLVRLFSAIKRDQTRLAKAGFKPTYGTPARGFGYELPLNRLKWRITSGVPSKHQGNTNNLRKAQFTRDNLTGKTHDK